MIYDISYKTLINSKPLHNRFNKIDRFIRIYKGTRYLILFCSEKYEAIFDRTRYLISLKRVTRYIFSNYFANIKVDFNDSLPIEKILTLYNVKIHIKFARNKNKNRYY